MLIDDLFYKLSNGGVGQGTMYREGKLKSTTDNFVKYELKLFLA